MGFSGMMMPFMPDLQMAKDMGRRDIRCGNRDILKELHDQGPQSLAELDPLLSCLWFGN